MARPKRDLTRITISIAPHVLEKIDAYAEQNSYTRTTAITVLCVEALNRVESND